MFSKALKQEPRDKTLYANRGLDLASSWQSPGGWLAVPEATRKGKTVTDLSCGLRLKRASAKEVSQVAFLRPELKRDEPNIYVLLKWRPQISNTDTANNYLHPSVRRQLGQELLGQIIICNLHLLPRQAEHPVAVDVLRVDSQTRGTAHGRGQAAPAAFRFAAFVGWLHPRSQVNSGPKRQRCSPRICTAPGTTGSGHLEPWLSVIQAEPRHTARQQAASPVAQVALEMRPVRCSCANSEITTASAPAVPMAGGTRNRYPGPRLPQCALVQTQLPWQLPLPTWCEQEARGLCPMENTGSRTGAAEDNPAGQAKATEGDAAGSRGEAAPRTGSSHAAPCRTPLINYADGLDRDTFKICKEFLRPFKKSLRKLSLPQHLSRKRKVKYTKESLTIIGDRIDLFLRQHCRASEVKHWKTWAPMGNLDAIWPCISRHWAGWVSAGDWCFPRLGKGCSSEAYKPQEKKEKKKKNITHRMMWRFVSLFSENDEKQLQKLYKYIKSNRMDKFKGRSHLAAGSNAAVNKQRLQGPLPPAIPVLQAPQGDSDIQWQRTPIPTQAPPAAPGLSTHIPLHTSALVQKMATKQHRQLPTAFQRLLCCPPESTDSVPGTSLSETSRSGPTTAETSMEVPEASRNNQGTNQDTEAITMNAPTGAQPSGSHGQLRYPQKGINLGSSPSTLTVTPVAPHSPPTNPSCLCQGLSVLGYSEGPDEHEVAGTRSKSRVKTSQSTNKDQKQLRSATCCLLEKAPRGPHSSKTGTWRPLVKQNCPLSDPFSLPLLDCNHLASRTQQGEERCKVTTRGPDPSKVRGFLPSQSSWLGCTLGLKHQNKGASGKTVQRKQSSDPLLAEPSASCTQTKSPPSPALPCSKAGALLFAHLQSSSPPQTKNLETFEFCQSKSGSRDLTANPRQAAPGALSGNPHTWFEAVKRFCCTEATQLV
ncbi:Chromodomain-helicase-DNA-binding protein 1 [Anas platyrhynchos]|uniref:Chromodomain-helicase-DNA-binding protein 1 n=1 Tax=Anas platyrhynchos TaxID=8839 RepID=R0LXB0_ANAPL|nr:Chromodomain-helicase-DNA-binding protein 1 [Anas platyrhynchos]